VGQAEGLCKTVWSERAMRVEVSSRGPDL
jgi:hypothetical protein